MYNANLDPLGIRGQSVGLRPYRTPRGWVVAGGVACVYIPPDLRQCSFFLSAQRGMEGVQPVGSGAFLLIRSPDNQKHFQIYAVTARHCIEACMEMNGPEADIFIRVNGVAGEFREHRTKAKDWISPPDDSGVDLAVCEFEDDGANAGFAVDIEFHEPVCAKDFEDEAISLGQDVFMIGLFVRHPGKKQNTPIARGGIFSAAPSDTVQINLRTQRNPLIKAAKVYLVECRSLGGLSGSPIFAQYATMHRTKYAIEMWNGVPPTRFLGIVSGHCQVNEHEIDAVTENWDPKKDKLNSGIAIVVPAEKVVEILNSEKFASNREIKFARLAAESAPTLDAVEKDEDDPIVNAKRVFDQSVGDSSAS